MRHELSHGILYIGRHAMENFEIFTLMLSNSQYRYALRIRNLFHDRSTKSLFFNNDGELVIEDTLEFLFSTMPFRNHSLTTRKRVLSIFRNMACVLVQSMEITENECMQLMHVLRRIDLMQLGTNYWINNVPDNIDDIPDSVQTHDEILSA